MTHRAIVLDLGPVPHTVRSWRNSGMTGTNPYASISNMASPMGHSVSSTPASTCRLWPSRMHIPQLSGLTSASVRALRSPAGLR